MIVLFLLLQLRIRFNSASARSSSRMNRPMSSSSSSSSAGIRRSKVRSLGGRSLLFEEDYTLAPTFKEFSISSSPFRWGVGILVLGALSFLSCQLEMELVQVGLVCLGLLLVVLWDLSGVVSKETVSFITSVGIQVKRYDGLGRLKGTIFYPQCNVKGVVINEVIKRQRVVSYLALILNTPDSGGRTIVPLFQTTLPRLETIKRIYAESQGSTKS